MTADIWRKKTLPSLKTAQPPAQQYEPLVEQADLVEAKAPRTLTRALRSLSSSSLDSINNGGPRRSSSMRRLQKVPSSSSTMLDRLHRRVSRDSSIPPSPVDMPGSPIDHSFSAMGIVKCGPLKTDVSLLKARTEYLVLTDHCLVKVGSVEAARGVFPQLALSEAYESQPDARSAMTAKSAVSEIRFEIPLHSLVAVFVEEGASPRFGLELWWFSPCPRLAYCKAHLFFSTPKERNDWLGSIHNMCRVRHRQSNAHAVVSDNLRIRIDHIVAHHETPFADGPSKNLIFPVAKRIVGTAQKPHAAEDSQQQVDGSSFYFVIGPYMCYLIEVLKADYGTPAGELRVKSSHFGTVTMAGFRASVASHEQRFLMSFRSPFGREARLDLASVHYRRIIEALLRVDRILKPMWPQHFQQSIFDIKGLPPPLQLTSGNDLGGIERSLQAYCAAFHTSMPHWTVEWYTSSQPVFRLMQSENSPYSPAQLMAVFRALRYNSFFKGISFRDVDLSPLAARKDYSPYGEGVVYTSLNGCKITKEHYDDLIESPVLTQEFHALLFASESIRCIDLANCLGIRDKRSSQARVSVDYASCRRTSSEIVRPILALARAELCTCHSITMSGNPLLSSDVDELASLLVLDHVHFRKLELAGCSLGDAGLSKLAVGLAGQMDSLQVLDISDNQGVVKSDILRHSLNQLRALRKLNIASSTRLDSRYPVVDEAAIHNWSLTELDLSCIALNEATVDVLAGYLQTGKSHSMQTLRLNKCGLTGRQLARILRSMGQARKVTVHANGNCLDEGIDDLCGAIACGFAPWSLFMQMVEFNYEINYTKLWKALTVNKTIECLSLAGSSTPDAASAEACQAVSDFFVNNDTVRFLDISGYDAKLDEGRLGKEFSRALIGMRSNRRIEHLRVRSQMLNVNIGDLAEAVGGNDTLHTLDCEDNDFNLSNFRHLVKYLESNTAIRHFSAFSPQELDRSMRKVASSVSIATPKRRSSVVSRFRHDKPPTPSGDKALVQQLKDQWETVIAELEQILQRNNRLYEESKYSDDEVESQTAAVTDGIFWASFGGLAIREHESRRSNSVSKPGSPSPKYAPESPRGAHGSGALRRSDSAASSAAVSPTSIGNGSFSTPDQTPPEAESPRGGSVASNTEAPFHDTDGNYTYFDAQAADQGLHMKAHRRAWKETVGCIKEEE